MKIIGQRIQRRKLFLIIFGVIVWISVIVTIGFLNQSEGSKKSSSPTFNTIDPTNPDSLKNFNGIAVQGRISNIDLPNFRVLIHFDLYPSGDLISNNDPLRRARDKIKAPTKAVKISFDTQVKSFPANVDFVSQDIAFTLRDGDTNEYPYDIYRSIWDLSATTDPGNSTTSPQSVKIALSLIGALQSWSFDNKIDQLSNSDFQTVNVVMFRSFTTKFFSLFVIAIMWCLSVAVLLLAVTLWYRDRKAEPPTIGFSIGMLFALPAVRNVQPGIPGIGCTADVVGFFWNMAMIAAAALLLLSNYILKYRRETPKMKKSSKSSLKNSATPVNATKEDKYIKDLEIDYTFQPTVNKDGSYPLIPNRKSSFPP